MTNAEPTSTDSTSPDSTTERAEKAERQPSLVAVSEENLAALLRATSAAPEPEVQPSPEAVTEAQEAPAVEEPVQNPPVEAVDARLALFAAVKEHRTEILRAAVTPATAPVDTAPAAVEQREYPPASLPSASLRPEAAPIQVTLPKSQPVIAPAPAAMPAPSQNRLLVGGIIGVLIVAVGLVTLWPKAKPPKAPSAAAVAPKDTAPLQVLAEPLGNGLMNVRWNAQSPVIAQARDGRLVITEHDKAPRIMALDLEQLKIGHLTYQATAESIEFDLEVNDRSGAVAKESILALSPTAGAAAQTPREQAATAKSQIVPAAAAPKVQTAVPAVVQPVVEVAQTSPVKARAFIPPPTQQKVEQRVVIDAPPALVNAPVTPLGVSLPASLGTISLPPAGAPRQVRVESNLQAGNLIKRVVPVYPVLARAAGVQGVVKFTAVIGKDGKIQNLKLISGPPPLVDAASGAVKQWVYRPTMLNGQPLEVITEINVNFTISGSAR